METRKREKDGTFRPADLKSKRFGRLKVVGRYKGITGPRRYWECICECGNKVVCETSNLNSGHTTSCGCYMKMRTSEIHFKHGLVHKRLHRIWSNMKRRCENLSHQYYKNYGGRGIQVWPSWHDAATFIKWALSHGYRDDLTLDRKDNDGDYTPKNCRWATRKEQCVTRRKPCH
jgi:hypothetical protein